MTCTACVPGGVCGKRAPRFVLHSIEGQTAYISFACEYHYRVHYGLTLDFSQTA